MPARPSRYVLLAAVSFLALSGCGGATKTVARTLATAATSASSQTTTSSAAGRTVTISEAQANAQDACMRAEEVPLKPSSAKCARILRATGADGNVPIVIECGGGVSTDGSCVAAGYVGRAFTNAANGAYGPPKQTAAVEGHPVDLATTGGNSWVCVLQKPGVRRCQSNKNSQVWVVFPTQTGVASAPAPPATTVTATTTAPAPASSSSFSGNGTKSLGTINLPTASTIEWTCSGCSTFGVSNSVNDSGTISIGSSAPSGSSAVDAGIYHDVQVISDGNWTIKIVPG
jgi:hypothetical protein